MLLTELNSNTIQYQICTKKTITEFTEDKINKDLSIKPKLILIMLTSIPLLYNLFFFHSAKKQAKRHGIPKRRRNLITMHQQTIYVVTLSILIITDQILLIILEMFYEELGVDNVFTIWWSFHLITFGLSNLSMNNWIFLNSARNFEEFNGLVGSEFPGQEQPLSTAIRTRIDVSFPQIYNSRRIHVMNRNFEEMIQA